MKKHHSRHSKHFNKKQSHKPAVPNTPSPNDTATHKAVLKRHLMTGEKITGLQALDLYQCFSLSQRLGELRRIHGLPIQSRFIRLPNKKLIKEYWLEQSYIQSQGKTA